MEIIAHIHTDFPTKFGIPRQSLLVDELAGQIVFTQDYKNPDCVRGLEGFSHLWLLWKFSEAQREGRSLTVRPPRLGGNQRVGVFASRSPYRPNPIGLSSVKLLKIEIDPSLGPVLTVAGADLMDGTPIYDIKPYLAFTDSHPEATCGFSEQTRQYALEVRFPEPLLLKIDEPARIALLEVLAQDPRPSYQNDPKRVYGVPFGNKDVRFSVADGVLTVREVVDYP